MSKRYLTVVGLILLFLNLLYCSFVVQLAWITRDLDARCMGSCYMDIFYYIHPVTQAMIALNFILAILLIFQPALSRYFRRGLFLQDAVEEDQPPERP